MESDTLAGLHEIDLALLTEMVRQDQRNPSFEILDWNVEAISHEKIIDTTGGLFRFAGQGRDGLETKPWTIVLKIVNKPPDLGLDPREWAYWKREMLAFESGMLAGLPGSLRAPRCYGMIERDSGGWIWMEYIVEATDRRWSLEHYQRAARQVGRFGGAFLEGTPLPDHPWLTEFFRSVYADYGRWGKYMNPESPTSAWQNVLVQQAFVESLRADVLRIWTDKYHFFDALDRLPQVFCHNDLHRRNLMLRTGAEGQEELIVLDWAVCGHGAIGTDMGELVATSLYYFEIDPAQAGELEAAVLEGYQAGLRDAGWSGDSRLARLGYLLSATFWMGATLPGWAAWMLGEGANINVMAMYGHSPDIVLAGWVKLCEFLVERADEARHLMRVLGVA